MQILYTLAALDVPAALHGGPKTAVELAPIVGASRCETVSCQNRHGSAAHRPEAAA